MGTDGHLQDGAGLGFAAAGGERLAAGAEVALLGRQVGRLGKGGEIRVAAAPVAGASALLATGASWRRVAGRVVVSDRRAVGGRGVGQGVGVVMGLATAAVEALLEQAYLGLEVGETLLQFGFALLDAGRGLRVGVGVGELLFELGLAEGGAVVEGLVAMDLLPGVPEQLLAGG
jgi:hypothetical protein